MLQMLNHSGKRSNQGLQVPTLLLRTWHFFPLRTLAVLMKLVLPVEILGLEDDVSEVQTASPVKTNETQTVKTRVDKIGQTSQKQRIGFKKIKACFVCKSTNHLIKDCDFHDKQSQDPKLKTMGNTGPRMDKPVWDNTKRVNHQIFSKYPHFRKNFVPSRVLTRTSLITPVKHNDKIAVHKVSIARPVSIAKPVSTDRPVSTARPVRTARPIRTARPVSTSRPASIVRPFAQKIAQTSGAIRPIYLRMDNIRPRGSYSPIKRCDNGTEFKNHAMNEFCAKKGIKKEFSKFDGKSDKGYLLGYSTTSKAFRVYNKRTKRVEENLHINFLEDQPNVTGTGPNWMYIRFYVAGSSGEDKGPNQENHTDVAIRKDNNQMTEDKIVMHDDLTKMIAQDSVDDFNNMDDTINGSPIPTLRIHKNHPKDQILGDPKSAVQKRVDSKGLRPQQRLVRGNQEEVYVHQLYALVILSSHNKVYKVDKSSLWSSFKP
ncbi:putative ribonuclease H-like domain-containing protein [Tanacetum coccineum]